jgi:uncharacterized protein (DUF1697 family)
MTIKVALLRGINVGGHRKVPMAELSALCGSIGFGRARTYIQSGNIVFSAAGTAPAAEKKLEAAIHERFGFPVDVLVRTASQWAAYVAANPLAKVAEAEPNRVVLLLSKSPPARDAVSALRPRAVDGERIEAAGDTIWIHYPGGQATTKLSPALLDRLVGSPVTARNWRTVAKLAEMTTG